MGYGAPRRGPPGRLPWPRRPWSAPSPSEPASSPSPSLLRAARALDLRGVVVAVGGVNRKPVLDRIRSAFAVRPGTMPIGLSEPVQDLGGGLAHIAHDLQGRCDRSVGRELHRKLGLVIALDDRALFNDEAAQPDSRCHLAVGQVVGDLARRPLVAGGAVELFVCNATERIHDRSVAFLVALDERSPFVGVHPIAPPFTLVATGLTTQAYPESAFRRDDHLRPFACIRCRGCDHMGPNGGPTGIGGGLEPANGIEPITCCLQN